VAGDLDPLVTDSDSLESGPLTLKSVSFQNVDPLGGSRKNVLLGVHSLRDFSHKTVTIYFVNTNKYSTQLRKAPDKLVAFTLFVFVRY